MEDAVAIVPSNRKGGALGVVALASAALLVLSGCGSTASAGVKAGAAAASTEAAPAATSALAADEWVANPGDFKEAANWDSAKKPEITLGGGAINPSNLDLVAGEPYQISITNNDSVDLGVGMKDFFRSSAVRKTESGAEIKLILFKEIFVKAGQTVELFLVPVMPGTYDMTGLAANGTPVDGMTGAVNVTGAVPTTPKPTIEKLSTVGEHVGRSLRLAAAIPTWDATATAVTITMGDTEEAHFFEPTDTALKVGVPATITFVNAGSTMHVYEMADFLKTAALWQVTGTGGWSTGGLAKPADVEAGVTTSLSVIPTQAGTFELTDSAPGMESMKATITVTE
jgi:uncharacterized cupredoxin-like copper-binding protein